MGGFFFRLYWQMMNEYDVMGENTNTKFCADETSVSQKEEQNQQVDGQILSHHPRSSSFFLTVVIVVVGSRRKKYTVYTKINCTVTDMYEEHGTVTTVVPFRPNLESEFPVILD